MQHLLISLPCGICMHFWYSRNFKANDFHCFIFNNARIRWENCFKLWHNCKQEYNLSTKCDGMFTWQIEKCVQFFCMESIQGDPFQCNKHPLHSNSILNYITLASVCMYRLQFNANDLELDITQTIMPKRSALCNIC